MKLPFQLPLLEDANSIQIAIGDTLNALLAGQIDHKTAGLLLYGLQTAATNVRHTDFETYESDRRATAYKPLDPEPELQEASNEPGESQPIIAAKSNPLPPKKGPYTAEQKELLDVACSLAMQRARDIKKQILGKS